jgi:peptidoglycan/LPS O-acetylase OafA/YrhL
MGTLRLLLAISVLLIYHSSPIAGIRMISGPGPLQAFYAISGFYMALVLNEKYATGQAGYREFITQRVLRLMPTYWVCLIASLVIAATLGTVLPAFVYSPLEYWRRCAGLLPLYQKLYLAISQIALIGQDWLMFMAVDPARGLYFTASPNAAPIPARHFQFVMPAWSLGVELTFYLIAPFLVRRRWWIIALVAATSVGARAAVRIFLHVPFAVEPWTYQFFPSELSFFLFGAIGYHFYAHARMRKWNLKPFGAIALGVVIAALFGLPHLQLPARTFVFSLLAAPCVPLIFAFSKQSAIDRWIGELSYTVYLVHAPVGAVLTYYTLPDGWKLLLATLPAAIAIRLLIEEPIDRLRQRMHERRTHLTEKPEVISPAPM